MVHRNWFVALVASMELAVAVACLGQQLLEEEVVAAAVRIGFLLAVGRLFVPRRLTFQPIVAESTPWQRGVALWAVSQQRRVQCTTDHAWRTHLESLLLLRGIESVIGLS
jgi:hypothetical protein